MSIEVMKQALTRLQLRTDTADLEAIAALNEAIEQAETKQINSTTLMSLTSLTNQPLTDEELRQCFLATNTAEP